VKEFAAKNNYEDMYLATPEFTKLLERQRSEMADFLTYISTPQKP